MLNFFSDLDKEFALEPEIIHYEEYTKKEPAATTALQSQNVSQRRLVLTSRRGESE